MASIVTQTADAVQAMLDGGSFSQTIKTIRGYAPAYVRKDFDDYCVAVIPASRDMDEFTRDDRENFITIHVAIRKAVKTDTNANTVIDSDKVLILVEEIIDFFRNKALATYADAQWQKTMNDPIFAPEIIENAKVITSVIQLIYRVFD